MAQNNKDSGFNPNQKLKKYKVLILSLLLSSKNIQCVIMSAQL